MNLVVIGRERAEKAVPPEDCSGRKFSPDEWEDLVRTILDGAEIQRDTNLDQLVRAGVRAGYARRMSAGIKASAKDGHLWFLGDLVDRLFDQMDGKDGYLVFIERPSWDIIGGKE